MISHNVLGHKLANGGLFTHIDILNIVQAIHIDKIKPSFLPDKTTVLGKVSDRKQAIFRFAQNLWGLSAEDWLVMEASWLSEARNKIGSLETEGKDNTDDVVSAELLIRVMGTCSVFHRVVTNQTPFMIVTNEALSSLNGSFTDAIAKGRTRMQTIPYPNDKGWITVYGYLREQGVMIGMGGGKFLPYPERSLPVLLSMLSRDKINPQAYI